MLRNVLRRFCVDSFCEFCVRFTQTIVLVYLGDVHKHCGTAVWHALLWLFRIGNSWRLTSLEYLSMGTMHEEKKTTHGYIIGVWKIYWTHALVKVGCFTGIESNPLLHIPIKGFPRKWSGKSNYWCKATFCLYLGFIKTTQKLLKTFLNGWILVYMLGLRFLLLSQQKWSKCFLKHF